MSEKNEWKENEALVLLVKKKARDFQANFEALVKEWAQFEALTLKAYKAMPKTDAMFFDSPLAPARTQLAFRQHLAKLGWKWEAALPWGPDKVRDFSEVIDDACKWGERIVKDEALAKKKAELAAKKTSEDIGAIA